MIIRLLFSCQQGIFRLEMVILIFQGFTRKQ